jgi:hypothetical protein
MDETKKAWEEVGAGFTKLGQIISERYRDLGEERAARPAAPEQGPVSDAIRRATDELDRAFTSLGETIRDDDARAHVRDTGKKLTEALDATFTAVGEEIRKAVGGRGSSGSDEPPADSGDSA